MIQVLHNNHIYSCDSLWNTLNKDGIIANFYQTVEIWIGEYPYQIVKEQNTEKIMSNLIENVKQDYEEYDADAVFLGDYYADNIIFDGKTYIFNYESINDSNYANSAGKDIENLIQIINAKMPHCCEIQNDH